MSIGGLLLTALGLCIVWIMIISNDIIEPKEPSKYEGESIGD